MSAGPVIAAEAVSRWIREAAPLFAAHWAEVRSAADRARMPLAVDHVRYAALETAGLLAAWTARTADGALVGYNVFILMAHPHYAGILFAQNDVIYVAPEHRGGGAGLGLIRAARRGLKARGVDRWSYHVKLGHDFGPVLDLMGMAPVETVWEGAL